MAVLVVILVEVMAVLVDIVLVEAPVEVVKGGVCAASIVTAVRGGATEGGALGDSEGDVTSEYVRLYRHENNSYCSQDL